MNRSPWRLEEVDGSPWRLEGVDCGDEQYPVESRFAICHTPPNEQDPRFDRSAPTSTSMYVHVCDQNDNAMYASTRWVPTVRLFLAWEDVAGGGAVEAGRTGACG